MKNHLETVFLVIALAVMLTSCGSNSGDKVSKFGNQDTAGQNSNTGQIIPKDGKALIAYFTVAENSDVDVVSSASVSEVAGEEKGRITALAEMIREKTEGDIFSIQTAKKYSGDIDKLVEDVQAEKDKDERPELVSHITNLEDYAIVFVGFPTWWYDLPKSMYSFFDEYDFSGKTIIPFNSSNGSRFSGFIEKIQDLEPDATVITNGFTASEQDVPKAEDDIGAWLDGLGF